MIIKIDVDGVIRNMFDNMCELYNREFNTDVKPEDIFDYDVDVVFPKIKEELGISAADYFFKINSRKVFLLSKPYDGAKEAIEKLQQNGHKVVICTWQYTTQNKLNTLYFLALNEIPYDDICFTRDKWMIQGDWLIDDNPEFIEDKRDKSRKIIVNMPYNKKVIPFLQRANSLQEAVDIILYGTEKVLKIEEIQELHKYDYKHMFNYDTN